MKAPAIAPRCLPARRREEGVALVITLSLVLLVTVAAVAFLSRATGGQAVENSRSQRILVGQIAETGADYTISTFLNEIACNSDTNRFPGCYLPTNTNAALDHENPPPSAIYMVPQRALTNTISPDDPDFLNLVRSSVNATVNGVGESNASSHGTAELSRNGRSVGAARWNAPMLLSGGGFTNSNQLPKWIYVTKEGTLTNAITTASASNVIGRFAYCAYDIGGLLDANVAGYPLSVATNSPEFPVLKGTLAGADLSRLPGFGESGSMDAFVRWRASNNAASPQTYTNAVIRYASAGCLQLPSELGLRHFTGRQDLIRLAKSGSGTLSPEALPYLTHFTRELARPMVLTNGLWSMARRYDLSQLAGWITNTAGLTSNGLAGAFPELTYFPPSSGSGIGSGVGTNPTLFQVLQAGINFTNSWEVLGPQGAFQPALWAGNTNLKAVAIGANLIDQFAGTTSPTRVKYLNDIVAGKKPLPYVSQVLIAYEIKPVGALMQLSVSVIPEVSGAGADSPQVTILPFLGAGSAYSLTGGVEWSTNPPTNGSVANISSSKTALIYVGTNTSGVENGFFSGTYAYDPDPLVQSGNTNGVLTITLKDLSFIISSGSNAPCYSAFGTNASTAGLFPPISADCNPLIPAQSIDLTQASSGVWTIATSDPRTLRNAGTLTQIQGLNNTITPQSFPPYTNGIVDTDVAAPANRINGVGELGYVFRESPWRSIDFVSGSNSADRNLLDLFSAYPTPESGIRAGVINLNTRQPAVLAAILSATPTGISGSGGISPLTASNIAQLMTGMNLVSTNYYDWPMSSSAPWTNRSQLVDLAYSCSTNTAIKGSLGTDKQSLESVARALGEVGQVRTWNLLLDVVSQSGKFSGGANATNATNFTVHGERRQWISVAIDRFTGQLIDRQVEEVTE